MKKKTTVNVGRLPALAGPRTLRMTMDDIHCPRGDPDSPGGCALSIRAMEVFPGIVRAIIFDTISHFIYKTHREYYRNGADTVRGVRYFDKHRVFPPGTYTFLKPSRSWTIEGRRQRQKKYKDRHNPDRELITGERRPATGRRSSGTNVKPRGQRQSGMNINGSFPVAATPLRRAQTKIAGQPIQPKAVLDIRPRRRERPTA